MAVVRRRLNYANPDGSVDTIHFETEAKVVLTADGSNVEAKLSGISTQIDQKLVPLEAKITELTGTGANSVDKKIESKIAAVVDGAPEAFDTFKEFYEWTQSHETDAAAMLASINDLKTRVAALEDGPGSYVLQAAD